MLDDSRAGLTSKPWTRRIWYPVSRLSQVAAAARIADRLLVLTEGDRQFALERGWQSDDRIDVIAHGVSDRFLAHSPQGGARGAGALFCGSWDLTKGVTYLVAAFNRLAEEGRPVPLTILGPGVPTDVVMNGFSETARPHVIVVERVAEERVIDEYRRHDVLVFPSTYEGFGLVVLEAMSQGLPVVAAPAGCAPDLVRDGETGSIVPFRDTQALACAVARIMSSPDERVRLGANCAVRVAGMSWTRTAERTVEVYARALALPGSVVRT
jgi:glycosyltransferase involved in cell wall biosynthesis